MRKITHFNTGVQYIQFCSVGGTANVWTYGDWYVIPRSKYTLDSSDTNGGSATIGSSTKPVYVASDGTITACSSELRDVIYSGIGTCSTAAATAAKVVTLPKFSLATNATILVRISTTNSATSGVTLNVNSTGAKSIYIGGSAWSTSNQLNAGDYLATYDGTYWKLTRIYLTDNDTVITESTVSG